MTAAVVTHGNSSNLHAMSHDTIFNKIQEVLPDCIASDDVGPFQEIFEGKVSEPIKVYVETAVRYYVMQSLCSGAEADLGKITAVAKLSTALARKEVCLPTLPMLVLSDAFDSLTVQQCERLFSFVESNVAIWKENLFFTPCKNQVLRMCNDVLRRLSRSQNTIFCGRILLFLARFFPFSERSGLNLISEFNLENVTTFSNTDTEECMEIADVKEEGDEDVKEVKEIEEQKDGRPSLDYTLYTKFWALQDFFRNPIQCYHKGPWKMFTTYTTDVLEAFSSFKLEGGSSSKDWGADGGPHTYPDSSDMQDCDQTIVDSLPDVKKIDQYFAKFLTNQRLLDLQFSDSNFRRYVLVQLLILCHYLTAAIKFKQESLGDVDTQWVRATEQKVFALLTETPPDGEQFVEIVRKILKRENQWNEWKNNGCPEIKKPTPSAMNGVATINGKPEGEEEQVTATAKRGRKRKLGDLVREADSRKKFVMANPEMTRLWNLCPDNVEATRLSKRDFIPSLDQYFTKSIEQIQAAEEVPVGDRLVSDGNFGWRGLRILACRSPHFFTHSTAPIATLPEYLTTMIKKLAKDLPAVNGRAAPQPAPARQQLQAATVEEEGKRKSDADEVVPIQNDEAEACEVDNEVEEEDEDAGRAELQPLSAQDQEALSDCLAKAGGDKWRVFIRKLGFQDDEVDYILEQKGGDVKDCMSHFLQLWVESYRRISLLLNPSKILEVDYILEQKGGDVKDCMSHFLQLWVENEGDEANKDTIIYTLAGLKMPEISSSAFQ